LQELREVVLAFLAKTERPSFY
jgi:hypothetical protein